MQEIAVWIKNIWLSVATIILGWLVKRTLETPERVSKLEHWVELTSGEHCAAMKEANDDIDSINKRCERRHETIVRTDQTVKDLKTALEKLEKLQREDTAKIEGYLIQILRNGKGSNNV